MAILGLYFLILLVVYPDFTSIGIISFLYCIRKSISYFLEIKYDGIMSKFLIKLLKT